MFEHYLIYSQRYSTKTTIGSQLLYLTDLPKLTTKPGSLYIHIEHHRFLVQVPHTLVPIHVLPGFSRAGTICHGYRTCLVRSALVPVPICSFSTHSDYSLLVPVPLCTDLTHVIPEPSKQQDTIHHYHYPQHQYFIKNTQAVN